MRRSRPGSLEAEASPAVHDRGQHDQQLLATNVREASHNMHPGPARSMGAHCHQAASLFKAGMVLLQAVHVSHAEGAGAAAGAGGPGRGGRADPPGPPHGPPARRARLRQGEAAPCWAPSMHIHQSQLCASELFWTMGLPSSIALDLATWDGCRLALWLSALTGAP